MKKILQYHHFIWFLLALALPFSSLANKQPKLILQITIDQLRGDLLYKYQDRFQKGGFNYLLNNGVVYRNAHHGHANTETIVGHVTLATGAYPSGHGLVGNIWFDRKLGSTVYNIEDPNYRLLSANADIDKSTEVDPTQKAANVDGRSPRSIQSSTFSDELVLATVGEAKVFGVSVKDRGAVSLAGQGGKAFWFSKASQEFVTSNYYYQQYPEWVVNWNNEKKPASYSEGAWELMHDKSSYKYGELDDRHWEGDIAGYGRTFPHPFGKASSKYFSTLLTISPVGDELTSDFAKTLIVNENLGKDKVTDYLAISYSSTDYVGHFYGMSSLESEDNLLRLDANLAKLFKFIDKKVGLKNTLIVLSADHGGPEVPGYLHEHKLKGEHLATLDWDELPDIKALKQKLNLSSTLISGYHHPYIYLDHDTVAQADINLAEIQELVAYQLSKMPDVHQAITSKQVEMGQLNQSRLNKAIINNYYPNRSGDIYLVFKPQDFINDLDGLKVPSVHGSPWRYDTFVPIIFAGFNVDEGEVFDVVETIDIAPTLSAIMKIKPPSASEGKILVDVLED